MFYKNYFCKAGGNYNMSFYKNLKKWVLILLVIVTALTIYFKKVKAETHDDVINKIEVLLEDGTDPVTNITQWQVFRIKASFYYLKER